MSSDVRSRVDEIKTRLDATRRVIPYEERDRHEKKQHAWSDFYQHAPADIQWLINQLEHKGKPNE